MTAYTLDHPEVQAAKAKFERTRVHGNGYKIGVLGFEELFALCAHSDTSLNALAKLDDTSATTMRGKYKKYFREFFGERAACSRQQTPALMRQVRQELLNETERRGYTLKTIACETENIRCRFASRYAINGHSCAFRIICKVHPASNCSNRFYGTCAVYRDVTESVELVVVRVAAPYHAKRTFIIPSRCLLTDLFEADTQVKTLQIPLQSRRTNRGCKTALRNLLAKHEEAWHLLDA